MACVFYINLSSVTHYGYEIDKSLGSKFKSKVGDDAAIPHSSGLHYTALTQMPRKKHIFTCVQAKGTCKYKTNLQPEFCQMRCGACSQEGKWQMVPLLTWLGVSDLL